MHLVYLIHGLFGSPGHLASMERSILHALQPDDEVEVRRAQSMSAIGTFDGVAENAYKCFAELKELISETQATHLSIVGYSMGGLCGRYLIGLLLTEGLLSNGEEGSSGVEPVLFATFATPHLGSQYHRRNLFGRAFDFIGSRVAGVSGHDLFNRSRVLDDLANPRMPYLRALSRFPHLYLFANATNDRTVPFWTSFIAPKNPFAHSSRLELKCPAKLPMLVDMQNSRLLAHKPRDRTVDLSRSEWWREFLGGLLVRQLLPVFLVVLLAFMGAISMLSFLKRCASLSFRPHHLNPGKHVVGRVGAALEETLDLGEHTTSLWLHSTAPQVQMESPTESKSGSGTVTPNGTAHLTTSSGANRRSRSPPISLDSYGIMSPGYEGLIDSTPADLDLSARTQRHIDTLNALPWRKFAVKLSTLHSHGLIVDRRGGSVEGKQLLDFFAKIFAQTHRQLVQNEVSKSEETVVS